MKQKYQRKWKWIFQRNWYQVILFKKRKRYTPITTPSSVKFRHKIGIQNIILFLDRMTIYTALFYKLRISLGFLTVSLLSNFLVVLCFFWVFLGGFCFCWFLGFFHTSRTCWKHQSKEALRSQKSKDRQYNGQKKMAINSSQNITQNTEYWTWPHNKPWGWLGCIGMANSSWSTSGTGCISVKRYEHHLIWLTSINTNMNFLQNISMLNWNGSRHYNTKLKNV